LRKSAREGTKEQTPFVINHHHHHRLNDSLSPVLTATSRIRGCQQFDPPQNQYPWPNWHKIWHGVGKSATWLPVQKFMQIRPWKRFGKWVKYAQIVFISMTHLQVKPLGGFYCRKITVVIIIYDAGLRQVCSQHMVQRVY